ncbi:MAG: RNA polymerase sigma factor [Planctomycetes bacterium]|nr:RNA polymerase sigma factor [Planctomycetota bacterium]
MPLGSEQDADRLLIEAMARGESDALAELVRRNGPWVRGVIFATCGRLDVVDDIQQEVWLRAWRRAGSLDRTRHWRGWLYSLARHAAIDEMRSSRRRRRLMEALADRLGRRADQLAVPARLALRQDYQRALRAIAALPEIYRVPFVLRHLGDWNYRQIAEAMHLPPETVETRLVRARRILRRMLARAQR